MSNPFDDATAAFATPIANDRPPQPTPQPPKSPAKLAGPGFYTDVAEADYHADPAPSPSLSSSLAATLLTETPRHAWFNHPRLNPDFEPVDNKKYDFGSVAHALLLGRGAEIAVIDAADWRTKAAQAERDEAIAAGKQPCLVEQYSRAEEMALAARAQLALDPENGDAFTDGDAEAVMLWREDWGDGAPIYCRAMADWVMKDRRRIYDYKTFAGENGADPEAFIKHIVRAGRDIQDPFYSRGLAALEGVDPSEISFRFVVQEPKPPYLLSVVEIEPISREWSAERAEFAIRLWGRCIGRGQWPGFVPRTYNVGVPAFAQMAWEDRRRSLELGEAVHQGGKE